LSPGYLRGQEYPEKGTSFAAPLDVKEPFSFGAASPPDR